jgi:ferritin
MLNIDVQTAGDLMSIALYAEHEAVRRYIRLAEAMHSYGNQEAASLFERMVEEERQHEYLIEEWADLEGIQLRTDIGPIRWEDPGVPTDYDGEAIDPAHSTPYRALAFAVHNEERAFRFYVHVAATADDETVREYAASMPKRWRRRNSAMPPCCAQCAGVPGEPNGKLATTSRTSNLLSFAHWLTC